MIQFSGEISPFLKQWFHKENAGLVIEKSNLGSAPNAVVHRYVLGKDT